MPIQFETLTHASVLMLDENAASLLKSMNLDPGKSGALRPEDIPAALQKLTLYIETEGQIENIDSKQTEDIDETPIALNTRAKPLMELMRHCIASNEFMQWSVVR